jgi:DNA-binding transcriptional regulator YhcF (GntR family)
MAQRGRPIPATTIQSIQRLQAALSIRKTAEAAGVSPNTVRKYSKAR